MISNSEITSEAVTDDAAEYDTAIASNASRLTTEMPIFPIPAPVRDGSAQTSDMSANDRSPAVATLQVPSGIETDGNSAGPNVGPSVPTIHVAPANNPRPAFDLPGANRLLSEFAEDLGQFFATADIYMYRDTPHILDKDRTSLKGVKADLFRSWSERFIYCVEGDTRKTMPTNVAKGVLISPQFQEHLRDVHHIQNVPMPALRKSGKVELLTEGYDPETKTLTAGMTASYSTDMSLQDAKEFLHSLTKDFPFRDEVSRAVSIAGMVTLFGLNLLPDRAIRPAFLVQGNRPGLGKTLLVQAALITTLGDAPTGVAATEETERRKVLQAAADQGKPTLVLDNLNGHIASKSLESFLTTSNVSGRAVGTSEIHESRKRTVVFMTGHGCTFNDDVSRRILISELYLESSPAQRSFAHYLDESTLLELRPKILSALYALVREWDKAGQPRPKHINNSFPAWSKVIGGIITHAGFQCVCQPREATRTLPPQDEDMSKLVAAMQSQYGTAGATFSGLISIARAHNLFRETLQSKDGRTTKSESTACGRLFSQYDNRVFGGSLRFVTLGKGHGRKYAVRQEIAADEYVN